MEPFKFQGWMLFARDVNPRHRPKVTVYFFSKRIPKLGKAIVRLPTRFSVMVNMHTGLPYLCNKSLGVGERALPGTLRMLYKMQPLEFEKWARDKLSARMSRRHAGDRGIDGWIKGDQPFIIRKTKSIPRPIIHAFTQAIRRVGKKRGIIISLSFSPNALEEADSAEDHEDVDIEFWTAEDILRGRV